MRFADRLVGCDAAAMTRSHIQRPYFAGLGAITAAAAIGLGVATAKQGPLPLAAALAILVVVLVVTRRLSTWSTFVLLLLFAIGLGRLYIQLGPNPLNSHRLQQVGLLALLAAVSLARLIGSRRTGLPPRLLLGLAIYAVGTGASIVLSTHNVLDEVEYRALLETLVFGPVVLLIAVIIRPSTTQARFLVVSLGLMACLQGVLALFQLADPATFDRIVIPLDPFTTSYSTSSHYVRYGRAFSVWQHAPAFGTLMAAITPLTFYWVHSARGREKPVAALALSLVAMGIVASGSVAPAIGALASVAAYLLVLSSRRTRVKAVVWVLVALTSVVILAHRVEADLSAVPVLSRVVQPWRDEGIGNSVEVRLALYSTALRMWEESPLWGVGLAQFSSGHSFAFATSAHSAFLQMLAERGLVGTIAFLALLCALGVRNVPLYREPTGTRSRPSRSLYLSLSLSSCVVLLTSITDYAINQWNFYLMFFLCQGTICAAQISSAEDEGECA